MFSFAYFRDARGLIVMQRQKIYKRHHGINYGVIFNDARPTFSSHLRLHIHIIIIGDRSNVNEDGRREFTFL